MTDSIKIIGGTPQPGNEATQIVVSPPAGLNADGKIPQPKPYEPGAINSSQQPGGPPPSLIVAGGKVKA
jgi:hypothetical protein